MSDFRRATGWITLAAVPALLGALSCARQTPEESAPQATSAQAMSPAERGEYVSIVAGCHDCHTPGAMYGAPDFERKLAGSDLGWQGPWGVSYARNLTSDIATGLGAWTDAEIERALRSGVKKDGTPILPPMPWPSLARLTPEDMAALIAYLRSVPAVSHKVPGIVPPGQKPAGAVVVLPPPPAWDAPRKP